MNPSSENRLKNSLGPQCLRLRWAFLVLMVGLILPTQAQLRLLQDQEVPQLFGGIPAQVDLRWKNSGNSNVTMAIHGRLLQASSATVAPLRQFQWKILEVLPGQTVVESAIIPLPPVAAETHFILQWLNADNAVVGTTELVVYPTNLLSELRALAEGLAIGLFDPQNLVKPLAKQASVEFDDLEMTGIANFTGRLAIIGPFESIKSEPQDLRARIKAALGNGACIIWFQPPDGRDQPLRPSFRIVYCRKGTILVAQDHLVGNLTDNPRSQLNLVQLARYCLGRIGGDERTVFEKGFL